VWEFAKGRGTVLIDFTENVLQILARKTEFLLVIFFEIDLCKLIYMYVIQIYKREIVSNVNILQELNINLILDNNIHFL